MRTLDVKGGRVSAVRRALLLATGERYFVVAINLATIAIVSRLLTPQEIGAYVLGMATVAFALAVREFATSEFLVQRETLAPDDVRTSFTIQMGLSLLIAAAVWMIAPAIGAFYGTDDLQPFLEVSLVAVLIEAASLPIVALLRRDMAFGKLAVLNVSSSAVGGLATCGLAWLGFSTMSFAWALLASATTAVALAFCFNPDIGIFRPSLKSWRMALAFGGYNGASRVLGKATETIPLFVLGRVLPVAAVGLYNRASVLCLVPDRVLLAGLISIALPALAGQLRAGNCLKEPYLRGIGYIAVVYWPAQAMLALLAYPIVDLALGPQWLEIVPLVQIIALSYFFCVPLVLTQSVLVAVGAFRDYLTATLISSPFSIAVMCTASFFGLKMLAASYLIALPFQVVVQQHFIRRHIDVRWLDLARSVRSSAIVTAGAALGPLLVIAGTGSGFELSIPAGIGGGLLGGLFWLAALYLTRHPFLNEIRDLIGWTDRAAILRRARPSTGSG
jgi:O-antigen/teichoic acid export membrane protein